jgi:hypothetical protein
MMEEVLYELMWFWNFIMYPLAYIGLDDFEYQVILLLLVIVFIRYAVKRRTPSLHANWNMLIDDFLYSPSEFYTSLKTTLLNQSIEGLKVAEVPLKVGSGLSSKRIYLRVQWKEFIYDCCMAPFGNGTFVSWWCYSKRSVGEVIVASIPLIGKWLALKWFPQTYYRYDTASMFRTYAEQSFQSVIDEITKDTGIRITPESRKPRLKEVFKR